jgi:exosortase
MITFLKSISRLEGWFIGLIKTPRAKGCLSILLTIFVYHSVMLELFHAWLKNHYYNHGFLIPLISGYLVYKNWEKLKTISCKPSLYGILFALIGIFVLILDKYFFNTLFLSSVGMLIFIMGGILFTYGKGHLRVLLFPVLFLFFMIPIPEFVFDLVIGPLQLTASMIGKIILRFLRIPVLRDGIYLHLAPFSIEVDKSCSSMHSLIALSALSFVIAYMMMESIGERILIVASSVPLALFILVLGAELIKRVHRSLATVFSNGRLFGSEKSKRPATSYK